MKRKRNGQALMSDPALPQSGLDVREVGPIAADVPSFPLGALALEPLRKKAESEGSADFTGLTAGEAAALCRELPAAELTLKLAAETLQRLGALGRAG